MSEDSLARKTSASVIWMTAQKWVTRLGGLFAIILLTRTLTPEDFGLAAAATTLMPLIYILSDVGFSSYIAQADSVDKRSLSTAFWFSSTCGIVLVAVTFVGAPVLGDLLDLPQVVPLIRVMTASILLIAVASVPTALMRRRMDFRRLALIEVTGSFIAQIAAVSAALLGAGAWSLVLQVIVSQIIVTLWVWLSARWKPSFAFSRRDFRRMASFGIPVVGTGLVSVIRDWAVTAIIISGLGVTEMGYITIAQRLVLTAQDLTVSALLPVTMVAFSKVRNSPERVKSSYLRASSISYAVVTPLMLFVAVAATILVPFLFGGDKSQSAQTTPALAAIVFLNVGFAIDEGLHVGLGRPGRWFLLISISFSLAVAALAFSVQFGLEVMMLVWVITAVAQAISRWLVVGPLIGASPWRVGMPMMGLIGPIIISTGAGLVILRLLDGLPSIFILGCSGLIMTLLYVASLRALRPTTFKDIIEVLPARISTQLRWALPREARLPDGRHDRDGSDQPDV